MGSTAPLEVCHSPFVLSCRIWYKLLVKRIEDTYRDPPENGLLASRLSRSLKVIESDTDRPQPLCITTSLVRSNVSVAALVAPSSEYR